MTVDDYHAHRSTFLPWFRKSQTPKSSQFTLTTKFEQRAPHPQNAFDIFEGRWASDIGGLFGADTGGMNLFTNDPRPKQAADALGMKGRLDGMSVLELGPLEAAHSYNLQRLGAKSIYAIEANAEAFLKCLIAKEFLGLDKVTFGLGDFTEYLESTDKRYDIVFNSGCLYHMSDPIKLLKLVSDHSDKTFLWTHYHDKDLDPVPRVALPAERFGYKATYHEAIYEGQDGPRFWGGNRATACWLEREHLIGALKHLGYQKVEILAEARENVPAGPHITIAASR